MAGHDGVRDVQQLPVHQVEVGAAYPAGLDLDEHLAGGGRGQRQLHRREGPARRREDHGAAGSRHRTIINPNVSVQRTIPLMENFAELRLESTASTSTRRGGMLQAGQTAPVFSLPDADMESFDFSSL